MIGADSEQFQVFMRKIGYSVGLEQTLVRLSDLCDAYIQEHTVTPQIWQRLVKETWNLKNDGIGDFFGSLNLIKRTKTRVDILPGLDLCALARQADPSNTALAGALLLLLMEADGEIFLNALAGSFEEDALVRRLTHVVHYKREVLFKIYRAPEIQSQLARIVGIDRQASNIGGAGKAKGLSGAKRTEKLESRTESLKGPSLPIIEISPDYLRKVVPRRRDWAASIGLWDVDAGRITRNGERLLRVLDESGMTLKSGELVLWPLSHEVSRLRINPTLFDTRIADYWDLVRSALVAIGAEEVISYDESDRELFIRVVGAQLQAYRDLNRPKAMLRRELPLTIAYYTAGAAFFLASRPIPNIPELIDDERKRDDSPLEIRSSRNSIGTLMVRSR
jgi:hypothetical protein